MRPHSLLIASVITTVLALPATAQQSMHRYMIYFKYTDQTIKAMSDNPQDRVAAGAKLAEAFGGKFEALYFFPMGGEWDGFAIDQLPSDTAIETLYMVARST
jgi:uncharacterized protein with GYD domain